MLEESDAEVKVIGRALGAISRAGRRAGKRERRGGRFPLDGDGDGFYSPRPGAPDKTPVPPEAVAPQASRKRRRPASVQSRNAASKSRAGGFKNWRSFLQPSARDKDNLGLKPEIVEKLSDEEASLLDYFTSIRPEKMGYWGESIVIKPRGFTGVAGFQVVQEMGGHPVRKTWENVKRIREEILQKHGSLETVQDCFDAIKKSFPNADTEILGARLKPGNPASEALRGMTMGLLHMAEIDPETAKYVRNVSNYMGYTAGYWKKNVNGSTGILPSLNGMGLAIGINLGGMDEKKVDVEAIMRMFKHYDTVGRDVPWSAEDYAIMARLREYGQDYWALAGKYGPISPGSEHASPEMVEKDKELLEQLVKDIALIQSMGVTIHEYGHAMHYARMLEDLEIDSDHTDLDLINKAFGRDFSSEREALEAIRAIDRQRNRTTAPPGQEKKTLVDFYSVPKRAKFPQSKKIIERVRRGDEISDLSAYLFFSSAASDIADKIESRNRDGLAPNTIDKARIQAKKISKYGGDDPEGYEAVAEWVSFRILTGEYKTGDVENVQQGSPISFDVDKRNHALTQTEFLEWATRGLIKSEPTSDFLDRLEVSESYICTGETRQDLGIVGNPRNRRNWRAGKLDRVRPEAEVKHFISLDNLNKALNTPIGGSRGGGSNVPFDGDGDGICFEGRLDRRPIPCPPGTRSGRVIRTRKGKRPVADLPGVSKATDPKRILPKEYMSKADEKLKRLGLTKGRIKRHTRKVLRRVNPNIRGGSEAWYPEVAERLERWAEETSEKYGKEISFEDAAAVMAVLSPLREFTKNLRDGRRLIEIALADEEFEIDRQRIRSLRTKLRKGETLSPLKRFREFERNHPPGKPLRPSDFADEDLDLLVALHPEIKEEGMVLSTGIAPIVLALQILRGFDADEILTGPKIRSFYSNLIEPEGDRVTIDTWMYRAMIPEDAELTSGGGFVGTLDEWERGSGKKRAPQALFQTTIANKSGVGKNVGTYPIFAEVIRELAEEFDLSPAALQAILWNHIRIEKDPNRNKPLTWGDIDEALGL